MPPVSQAGAEGGSPPHWAVQPGSLVWAWELQKGRDMAQHISHGADVEQLDDIAVGLRRQSEKIADVGGRGASLLEKLRALWDGPDFEKFSNDWRAAHRVIDDAESSMRTFSRKLVNESEHQRHSSGAPTGDIHGSSASGPRLGGHGQTPTGGTPSFERVDQGEFRGPGEGRLEGGPAFERLAPDAGFAQVQPATPTILLGPLLGGGEGLTLQVPGLPPIQIPLPNFPFVADNMMLMMPQISGAEIIDQQDLAQPAFERLDATGEAFTRADIVSDAGSTGAGEAFERSDLSASIDTSTGDPAFARDSAGSEPAGSEFAAAADPASASESPADPPSPPPAQVPTGDGAQMTTAPESAGQRSVAFDPLIASLSGNYAADGSQMGDWLGLGDLDLTPWN